MAWIEDLDQAITARAKKDSIAIFDGKNQHSWVELKSLIQKTQEKFQEVGIKPGDCVFLKMEEFSFHVISSFLALCLQKCVIVPVRVPKEDTDRIEKLSGQIIPKNIIEIYNGKVEILPYQGEPESNHMGDSAANLVDQLSGAGIVFASSGTTGTPKLILQDVNKLFNRYKIRPRCGRNKSALLLLSDHIGGINTLMANMASGSASVVIEDRSASAVAHEIEDKRITTLPASPSFLRLLLNHSKSANIDLSSLKLITYGSERMPRALLDELHSSFANIKFIQTYGSTELGIVETTDAEDNYFQLNLNSDMYRVEDGELRISKPESFIGYIGLKQENTPWLKTGDIVDQTPEGAITVVARKDDIINVGGEKVYPVEVEQALLQCRHVDDAMVYGETNPLAGQIVCAQVVCSKPEMTGSQLQSSVFEDLRGKLDSFKIPVKVQIVKSLALNDRLKRTKTQGTGT